MASEPVAQELIVDPSLTVYSVLSDPDEAGLDSDRDAEGPDGPVVPYRAKTQMFLLTRPSPACTHIAPAPTVLEHSYHLYIRHDTISTTHTAFYVIVNVSVAFVDFCHCWQMTAERNGYTGYRSCPCRVHVLVLVHEQLSLLCRSTPLPALFCLGLIRLRLWESNVLRRVVICLKKFRLHAKVC